MAAVSSAGTSTWLSLLTTLVWLGTASSLDSSSLLVGVEGTGGFLVTINLSLIGFLGVGLDGVGLDGLGGTRSCGLR